MMTNALRLTAKTWRRVKPLAKRWGIGVALALLTTVTTGVSLTGSTQPVAAAPQSAPQAIQWAPCPPTPGLPDAHQECATLSVPLDYRAPNGQKIDIAISRIKAASASQRRGILLSNPGGPGGSGVDMPRILTIILPNEVIKHYDLIGFDPRGIGASAPVSCGLPAEQADQAYVPLMQPGGFPATVDFVHDVADSCAATSGATMPFMTTANTARDMEQIRLALGDPKISFLGYSYGTYLGAVYASLFPDRTDRFVLDSAVNPAGVWRQVFRDWGPAAALRFPDFANFVAANDATYHLGDTPAEVNKLYFTLIERLRQQSFTIPQGTSSILIADGTVMGDELFRSTTFGGLYDDADFADLANIWQLVNEAPTANASTSTTAVAAAAVPEDNFTASGLSILCGDAPWSRVVMKYRMELTMDKMLYPMFGELGSNIWPCAFWASQPIESPVPINPVGPSNNIMVIQGRRDPATPYWGGVNMRQALGQRARLVSVDIGGHAIYGLKPNECANDLATAFLADGTFPATDQSCAADEAATLTSQTAEQRQAAIKLLDRIRPHKSER